MKSNETSAPRGSLGNGPTDANRRVQKILAFFHGAMALALILGAAQSVSAIVITPPPDKWIYEPESVLTEDFYLKIFNPAASPVIVGIAGNQLFPTKGYGDPSDRPSVAEAFNYVDIWNNEIDKISHKDGVDVFTNGWVNVNAGQSIFLKFGIQWQGEPGASEETSADWGAIKVEFDFWSSTELKGPVLVNTLYAVFGEKDAKFTGKEIPYSAPEMGSGLPLLVLGITTLGILGNLVGPHPYFRSAKSGVRLF